MPVTPSLNAVIVAVPLTPDVTTPVFASTVVSRWFSSRRGLVMGILTAATASGQLVFLPLLSSLASGAGWRWVGFTIAMCALAVVPLVVMFLRNRPADMANTAPPTASQAALKSQLHKAVTSGKISAEQVGQVTFDAIRDERFYVITHERMMPSIELRLQDVVQRRNPTDPFTYKPDVAAKAR